jgi:hypothetical protein
MKRCRGSGGSSPIYTVGGTDTSCLSGAGLDNAVVYSSLALGQVPTTLTWVPFALDDYHILRLTNGRASLFCPA